MTPNQLRSGLYVAARWVGHYQAARRGRLPQRLANVVIGRALGRVGGMLWR